MSRPGIGVLLALASLRQALGRGFLQPPRNVTLVLKDFELFLMWLPADGYPPQVSYTVQWIDPYDAQWNDVSHCRDILESTCNLTCVSPEQNNRHWVRVKAQTRTSDGNVSSAWVQLDKGIEYAVDVELAPPRLQVERKKTSLLVNTTFSYPSCVKDIFQHLAYDLEFWATGTEDIMPYRNMMMDQAIDINITQLSSGNYCLRARGFFPTSKKWSSFSKPSCLLLHEKGENWKWVALPLLLMLSAGALVVFLCYKNRFTQIKMPEVLDFPGHRSPNKLLEFSQRELIQVDDLTCTAVPFVSGRRTRPGPQIYSTFSPSLLEEDEGEDEDEDEDEDDSGNHIPYTEVRQFQRKHTHCQVTDTGQKTADLSSQAGSFLPNEGCWPDLMVPGSLILAEEDISGLPESRRTSFSENSLVEEFLRFPTSAPAAGEGQQNGNWDIDFSLQWPIQMERPDCIFLSRMQPVAAGGSPEAIPEILDGSEVTPFWILGKQDACEFLLERGFENDSSSCGGDTVEHSLFNASLEGLEEGVPGGSRDLELGSGPEPVFDEYLPRHTNYISRIPLQ
ncbi:Interferon lambda receptor 1 [Varanus komodoensis]|uniref:Interferon lambda receptor 1 n=1 Tax=Varanus komodoensis TaxID=61221 RepID=A0A8D2JJA4_VARKO|nr:interferon lambda receptor 1 isoform X2 [Varanus komodoensis]KAF7236517.1 Interferon lambda receptor 1 [Varanus komodoensis]